MEGPLAEAISPGPPAGAARTPYRPDFLWPSLSAGAAGLLARVSLESLCRDASHNRIERAEAQAPMYFI